MSDVVFTEEDGIIIIKPANYVAHPNDCPVCGFAFRHVDDLVEYKNYGCCIDCSLIFRQPNAKKWLEGWRPTRKEVTNIIINNTMI